MLRCAQHDIPVMIHWKVYECYVVRFRPISYTPKHLAEKILQSKPALEGERKQVTVLFARGACYPGWLEPVDLLLCLSSF
jgi:hypothetical protein